MEDPDPPTLDAARRGDPEAVAEILTLLQPHVWRFVRTLERNRETAEDLTQEVLLRTVRALPRFRGDSRFRTWVFTIARNVVRDEQRRVARRPSTVVADERVEPVSPGSEPPDTVAVWAAVDALPEPLREVFVLVEVMGLRYREVAVLTDVAEGTVKSRMFHARRELTRWFEADRGIADG